MDHIKVLKRAWHMAWRYRALWVFGIVLALTTFSWGRAALYDLVGGGDENGNRAILNFTPPDDFSIEMPELDISPGGQVYLEALPEVVSTIIAIGIGLACLSVVLAIAAKIARYVSETALIRLVDDHEETGEQRRVRQGLRLGWSRTAWRLFLIDLLIDVPAALAFILLLLLALAPLLLWTAGSEAAGLIGTVATIGLFFLIIFLAIIFGAALSLLKRFFRRVCALDGLGVTESIRRGYAVVRGNLKDVGLMWLIMLGVSLGWPVVIIPIVFLLLGVGVVLGGALALLVGGLGGLFLEEAARWILAGAVGIPIFLLVLVAPLVFLEGLLEVFRSSTWTLTYRELRALEGLESEQLPELDAAGPA